LKSPQTTELTVAAGQTTWLVRRCSTSKNRNMHYDARAELL